MILLPNSNREEITNIEQLNEQVVNEVYFGDSVMEPILRQFSKFRTKWIGNDYNPKINYDPDLIKFNRMIEDQFGYFRFCLAVDPSYDLNAFIYPIQLFSEEEARKGYVENLKVYKSNKGFKYDKKAHVSAVGSIYHGLLYSKDYSDRELIGILLHEIGHSFFTTVTADGNVTGSKANALLAIATNISSLIKFNKKTTPEEADRNIEKLGVLSKVKLLFSKGAKKVVNKIHSVANTAAGMNKNRMYNEYTNEKFADTFASMYGYGADVQTALDRMMRSQIDFYFPKKAPGPIKCAIKVALLSVSNMVAFMNNAQDEHPEGLARIKTQIDYLERELRNATLDPLMKKELQNQLDAQRKLIKDFIEYSSDEDGYKAYRIYYTKLYEKYGGDRREKVTDNEALFSHIDKRVEEILNQEAAIEDDDEFEDDDVEPLNELIEGKCSKKKKVNESVVLLTELF